MPRNQGTSRKGKPGKYDRAAGMGRALQKATGNKYRPRSNGKARSGDGGMSMQHGVESIGIDNTMADNNKTKSVLEMDDLQDFLTQAEMAGRDFTSEREGLVVLDTTARAYQPGQPRVKWADNKDDKNIANFVFQELSVPRRPEWDESMSKQQLEINESKAFLEWRRGIAAKEEELLHTSSTVTPFEKNLEVWRQLWRVLERSSCLLQLVDARNPLFYLSKDLKDYANTLGKPMIVLINKSDYLTSKQRLQWKKYFINNGWENPLFFSAVLEQQKLDKAAQQERKRQQQQQLLDRGSIPVEGDDDSDNDEEEEEVTAERTSEDANDQGDKRVDGDYEERRDTLTDLEQSNDNEEDVPLLTREQLMDVMLNFAKKNNCKPDIRYDNRIQFGMVGFPNVGKSSVINVLVGSSKHTHGLVRVGVAAQPGKTKHFQTLIVSNDMMLCDCPGLVFPSFVSNTADLIAAGVYPIAQMRNHWPVTNLICERISREILNATYGIQLPQPTAHELRERGINNNVIPPPTGEELLGTFCIARSMLAASSGVPDYQRASRYIIKDYAVGKLLYCHPPPDCTDIDAFHSETTKTALANTAKLKERLERQRKQQQENNNKINDEIENDSSIDDDDDDTENPADNVEVDDDLLELIGASAPDDLIIDEKKMINKPGKLGKKGKTPKQKWGKKDRKNRNKDPYGCHSTPDQSLFDGGSSSGGVIVNAGRYSQRGYTRPTSYPTVKP